MSNRWGFGAGPFPCGFPNHISNDLTGPLKNYPVKFTQTEAEDIEWTWKTIQMAAAGVSVTIQSPPGGAGESYTVSFPSPFISTLTADPDCATWADLVQDGRFPHTRSWPALGDSRTSSITIPSDLGGGTGVLSVTVSADLSDLFFVTASSPREFVKQLGMRINISVATDGSTISALLTSFPLGGSFPELGNWDAFGKPVPYSDEGGNPALTITVGAFSLTDTGARLTPPGPIG